MTDPRPFIDPRQFFDGVKMVESIKGLPPGRYARWRPVEDARPGLHWNSYAKEPWNPAKVKPRLQIVQVFARGSVWKEAPERLFMAHALGFEVPKGYTVHHLDCNAFNNDLRNLALLPVGQHGYLHAHMVHGPKWLAEDPERFRRSLRKICETILPPDRGARARAVARSMHPSVTAALGVSEFDKGHPNYAHLSQLLPEVQRCIRLHWEMLRFVQVIVNRYRLRSHDDPAPSGSSLS